MVINPSIERVTCPWCLDSHYGMDDHTPYIHEIFQYPIYQWIGLRDNFSRNAPYFSWENRWFPVYIFPTKPMICSYTIYTFSTSMFQWYVLSTIYPWYTHDIFHPFFLPIPVKSPVKSASGQGVAATTDANWVPGRWKTKFDQDTKWAPKR